MGCIFGPVPSRRLGRSLGVDLVPFKTCTYNCIYCQLGRTTNRTLERHEWVPLDDVLGELETKLATQPDYITLSGSGEPTLYSRTGELIERIKSLTDVPVAVLTNGSLLWDADIRSQLMDADLVIPSLDAGDGAMFQAVNRPHEDISFEEMLSGLIEFCRQFRGQYWLEVMFLAGHNAIHDEAAKLAEGLVGWWMFDEGVGRTATDSSGAGNGGTFVGEPRWIEGQQGGALSFRGEGAGVEFRVPAGLALAEVTVSMVATLYTS